MNVRFRPDTVCAETTRSHIRYRKFGKKITYHDRNVWKNKVKGGGILGGVVGKIFYIRNASGGRPVKVPGQDL